MYGHAHLLLPQNACSCGRPGVLLDDDGKRLCGRCSLEAEKRLLQASQTLDGQVPAEA